MKTWLKGILAALIGGATNSIGVTFALPSDFLSANPGLIAKVALVGALIAVAHYLAKSPLPEDQ